MRIALVCPYGLDRPGGVQSVVLHLAHIYQELGSDCVLIAPGEDVGFSPVPIQDLQVELVGRAVGIRVNRSVAPLAFSPLAAKRAIDAARQADVVHVHEPYAPFVSLSVARSVRRPTIGTFHSAPTRALAGVYRGIGPLLRRWARQVDMYTAVSSTAATAVRTFVGDVQIVPNGVEGFETLPATPERSGVVFLGRSDPRKGLSTLLEAWPSVRDSVPEAELRVIGVEHGPHLAGIEYLGRVSEARKREVLSSSLVLACPNTDAESFGIVPLEGMAAGCAVAASDLDAFRELLGDAASYHPAGDPSALALTLIELVSDPHESDRLGTRARERSRPYEWSEVGRQYHNLLGLLLDRG